MSVRMCNIVFILSCSVKLTWKNYVNRGRYLDTEKFLIPCLVVMNCHFSSSTKPESYVIFWSWVRRRCLRSTSSPSLIVRRTRLSNVGERAFPVAAARVWNDLPQHVMAAESLPVFCSRLKTRLFRRCFQWHPYCCRAREMTVSFRTR